MYSSSATACISPPLTPKRRKQSSNSPPAPSTKPASPSSSATTSNAPANASSRAIAESPPAAPKRSSLPQRMKEPSPAAANTIQPHSAAQAKSPQSKTAPSRSGSSPSG